MSQGNRWQERLIDVANGFDTLFDHLARAASARRGPDTRPLHIVPYRGFGTAAGLVVRGRVLRAYDVRPPRAGDGTLRNVLNMYRRFESDEVPWARVAVRATGFAHEAARVAVADNEGLFEAVLPYPGGPPAGPPGAPAPLWRPVDLNLLHPRPWDGAQVSARGEVLVPPPEAQLAVISDIDDTVVRTEATRVLRMARLVFFGNARTRLPFPGAATLYQALHWGRAGRPLNPVFYVSSSPWNLYDLLVDFLHLRGFPAGPLYLRDWGIRPKEGSLRDHHRHKLAAIRRLLDAYPRLPFLLIGDSGQSDPEIYAEVVRQAPGRIPAVYIRDVSRTAARSDAIAALSQAVAAAGSSLVLAHDSFAVARDAASRGWIDPRAPLAVASALDG
ncbi:MAG TPA: phosphatase domain-containing protein [Chloroflexota bacterium]|nr:phosphatase domain-containing protein [Chloroflexota bacterium]